LDVHVHVSAWYWPGCDGIAIGFLSGEMWRIDLVGGGHWYSCIIMPPMKNGIESIRSFDSTFFPFIMIYDWESATHAAVARPSKVGLDAFVSQAEWECNVHGSTYLCVG